MKNRDPQRPGIDRTLRCFVCATMLLPASTSAYGQLVATPIGESVLDANALVLADSGAFSRTINGTPFQQSVLLSYAGYQYAAWYRLGAEDEDLMVGRRPLEGGDWAPLDTGYGLDNGDGSNPTASRRWDSHNVVSMEISGDGRLHLVFDHHVDPLRYVTTERGAAGGVWDASIFIDERSSLDVGDLPIPRVTYPRCTRLGDDLVFTYRDRGSTNGDHYLARYSARTGQWTAPREVIDGQAGTYVDLNGDDSTSRNAYLNGVSVDASGRMHLTWTWREASGVGNHDVHYAYSDDGGANWRNNGGGLVATPSEPIDFDSPGVRVVDLDHRQALINQQGQAVDSEGVVHAVLRHRRQEPGSEWQPGDGLFDTADAAYHHYYRDPESGDWSVAKLPLESGQRPGNRPSVGVDGTGNVYALYTQGRDLVVAGARKLGDGYSDWRVLHRDRRDFQGTPQLDRGRLFEEGVLSVFVQDDPSITFENQPTSSTLRVLDFWVGRPGDYNHDGSVDAADYTRWRDGFAPDVSPIGYELWRSSFEATASAASAPEPAACVSLVVLCVGSIASHGARRVT